MANNKPYLSIVIPCYNESENLKRNVLDEVYNFLTKQQFSWEVVVSDDGSTDDSREIVKKQIMLTTLSLLFGMKILFFQLNLQRNL